jgi:hypothetical protein
MTSPTIQEVEQVLDAFILHVDVPAPIRSALDVVPEAVLDLAAPTATAGGMQTNDNTYDKDDQLCGIDALFSSIDPPLLQQSA